MGLFHSSESTLLGGELSAEKVEEEEEDENGSMLDSDFSLDCLGLRRLNGLFGCCLNELKGALGMVGEREGGVASLVLI